MPLEHTKVNNLQGGWYIQYKNGDVLTEEEMSWNLVPNKKDIKLMGLKRMNKRYELVDKEIFSQPGETHFREIVINNGTGFAVTKQTLVGWFIGYYKKDCKELLRVCAETGKVTIEEVPYEKF